MTKDRILLLDGDNSVYTLGALTDDSDDVLVLTQRLYDGGTFKISNLISKSFDIKSFQDTVRFTIKSSKELLRMRKPSMPYKLKIGSSVRYKNKTYQVIGYFFNQFAQLNIVSPILFNPSNLVTDVANLFYGLRTNDEVIEIINDNFTAGKYSNDIVFPLSFGVKSYKKELSNVKPPPFTSLDSLIVKKKEQTKVGEPLIPYEFDTNQLNRKKILNTLQKRVNDGIINQEEVDYFENISTFEDLVSKRIPSTKDFKEFYSLYEKEGSGHLRVGDGEPPLLPYNLVSQNKLLIGLKDYEYKTPIGSLYPIMKVGMLSNSYKLYNSAFGKEYFFGILDVGRNNGYVYTSRIINNLLFSETYKSKYEPKVLNSTKEFMEFHDYDFITKQNTISLTDSTYSLKENTLYGGFYCTSGNRVYNSLTDEKVLPFGTIFKKNGIYYYVLSYLNSSTNQSTHCLCVKASSRTSVTFIDYHPQNLTEVKRNFKKFTKDEVYKAFKKEGHIFDIDDSFYSLPQSAERRKEEEKTPSSTIVSDVFLENRADQFEVLQSNFPELSNTFLGILSVLDKKIAKPKLKELVQEQGLVYLLLTNNYLDSNEMRKTYDDDKDTSMLNLVKSIAERPLENTLGGINQEGGENISAKIKTLAVNTHKILVSEDNKAFYVGLKSYEDFQKYAISRIAINLRDNNNLFILNDRKVWRNGSISFPTHNVYSSVSLDCFLGTLPNMYVSGIKEIFFYDEKGVRQTKYYFYKQENYRNLFSLEVPDYTKFISRMYLYSQFIFVHSVLQVLYKNSLRALSSQADNELEFFLEDENFIREIRQYDLSLPLNYMIEMGFLKELYLLSGDDAINFGKLNEEQQKLYSVFRYNFLVKTDDKDDLDAFKTLIKSLDNLYGGIFNLEEKIINNKEQKLFSNFPKVETKEEEIDESDVFDDSELFEDAFEELGDAFLENIEELDIDELI